MFEIKLSPPAIYIQDDKNWKEFLHSDGSIYRTVEYFPTKEAAQKVLDKFQPKPKHEWKHGDVFKNHYGIPMIYLSIDSKVKIYCLSMCTFNHPGDILEGAKFLFNIMEKL